MNESISDFLLELGLPQYLSIFESNDIDVEIMKSLTSENLKEIGINSLGHRQKILRAISESDYSVSPSSGSDLKNIIKGVGGVMGGVLGGVISNEIVNILDPIIRQSAQHAGSIIQGSQLFQFCSRGFISYINSPERGSKCIDLIHKNWDGTLVDEKWIKGALQTTALRKRPNKIPKQRGDLGYSKGKKTLAIKQAKRFLAELRDSGADRYPLILKKNCESLLEAMESIGLFWTFGRSQKFFNILTKYWYCVATGYPDLLKSNDAELVKEISALLDAPIDSITLKHIRGFKHQIKGLNLENVYWGWNMDYREYLAIQKFLESLPKEMGVPKIAYELIEVWQLSSPKNNYPVKLFLKAEQPNHQ